MTLHLWHILDTNYSYLFQMVSPTPLTQSKSINKLIYYEIMKKNLGLKNFLWSKYVKTWDIYHNWSKEGLK